LGRVAFCLSSPSSLRAAKPTLGREEEESHARIYEKRMEYYIIKSLLNKR